MKIRYALAFLCCWAIGSQSQAQTVQWAHRLKDFSSTLGGKQFSPSQVLGKPNAMPQGGQSACAWMAKNANSPSEYLQVSFEKPMKVKQIAVFENYNPGSITGIFLINASGKTEKVYKANAAALGTENVIGVRRIIITSGTGNRKRSAPAEAPKITDASRVLRVNIPLTDYEVYGVKVEMNCAAYLGPKQIDAIGISDSEQPIDAVINVIPDIQFASAPENLGTQINSPYTEIGALISPDGQRLYLTRKDHPENINGATANDDIWYADLDAQGKWSLAKNVASPLNDKHHNLVEAVTPDGNMLLLGNRYGEDRGDGVSVTYKTANGWAFPTNLDVKNFRNYDRYVNFYLANDGKVILMSIEHDDSYGEKDLYVSFLQPDNSWSSPKNLGAGINSAESDGTPFLASDGKTLYFSTDGRSTFGSADIFMSTRLDDSWQKWSEPINLGQQINTDEWDAYYSLPASGEYAYFTSYKNSLGKSDIFRIKLPPQIKPEPVVLISGKVLNAKTKEPLEAKISYETLPNGKEVGIARSEPGTGNYKIVLPAGKLYGFLAQTEHFYPINQNLDVSELKAYTEIKRDLYLAPIEKGEIIRLNNIFFDFAKAILKTESYPELNRVVELLNANPTMEIAIQGHTDNVGADMDNLKLSQDRSQAVVTYLVEKGITQARLGAKGFGEIKPIATNDTDEGRATNRRVEFEVIK
ncbi:MAG: OmpA family protein [Bacteroidota bacterium]